MERKLATIRKISAVDQIPGADAIQVATVDGWKVVIRAGEYSAGDLAIYLEIDSWVPNKYAPFLSKGKEPRVYEGVAGEKLRTIKLRGQISQGLLLPLNTHAQIEDANESNIGMDVTEILGVKKWEPVLDAQVAGMALGLFPSFIRKTDQERCQNLGGRIFNYEDTTEDFDVSNIPAEAIDKMIERGDLVKAEASSGGESLYKKVYKAQASIDDEYEVSLKLDGTSCTFFHKDGEIGVCSRNLQLKMDEDNAGNALVRMFIDSGLADAIKYLGNVAIQGELMGPGIQGNRENLKQTEFFVFDIQNIDSGKYFDPLTRRTLVGELVTNGVKIRHVPIIAYSAKLLDSLGLKDVAGLLHFAERKSLNHDVAEGVVFKRLDGAFSFKAISNLFLEKSKD